MRINVSYRNQFESLIRTVDRFERNFNEGLPWDNIALYIAEEVEQIFREEGGLGQWEDLNESYEAWKSRAYPGQTILRLTDRYYRAATKIGSPENYLELTNNVLEYAVDGIPYVSYHEEGTDVLPARPVFLELAEDQTFQLGIFEIFDNWVEEQLAEEAFLNG